MTYTNFKAELFYSAMSAGDTCAGNKNCHLIIPPVTTGCFSECQILILAEVFIPPQTELEGVYRSQCMIGCDWLILIRRNQTWHT